MVECSTALSLAVGGREDCFEIKEEKTPPEIARALSRVDSTSVDGAPKAKAAGTRKKLKLSKLQLALLEEAFRAHTTLAPEQKQGLAQRLDLQPRQVEVWFQNGRARTKSKQAEVDYEFLKECCERLATDNRWLKRELMELKLMSKSHPRSPSPRDHAELRRPRAARLSIYCSSCEKMTVIGCESNSSSN